jgi:DNA primase
VLYVFEAPVDMLSYITLYPGEWQQHSYVALCGVGSQAMLWMLEQYPQLRKVTLCLDNDEAGHKASERLKNQLAEKGYPSQRLISKEKDWNDDLVAVGQHKQSGFEMKMA